MTELLSYYSVVRILRTSRSSALGVDGCLGVIAEVSQSGGEVCMVNGPDIVATGEVLGRQRFR